MNTSLYLPADWPDDGSVTPASVQPENVHAFTTLRTGGVSKGGYSEYNLADHVGDEPQAVRSNRAKLRNDLSLPAEPVWLEQVHSNKVVRADEISAGQIVQADASFTAKKGVVCVVMTADCLPVFICNQAGTEVAVAHAGWRGLHAGIITNTIKAMQSSAEQLLVSLGPAIGAGEFEVGEDVLMAFVDKNSANRSAFVSTTKGHYLCDIYQLARTELRSIGVEKVAGGNDCTYREEQRFYSYRRQQKTGRMASLIWLS